MANELSNLSSPKIIGAALLILLIWSISGIVALNNISAAMPNPPKLRHLWSHEALGQVLSNPVVIGDKIVYGTLDGNLVALSQKNGQQAWKKNFTDPIFAISKDSQSNLYIGTGLHFNTQGQLAAIGSDTGNILWKKTLPGHMEEAASIDENNNRIWTSGGPSGLWAINKSDGSTIYNAPLGHMDTTALLHNDILYAPAQTSEESTESNFFAIRADDGKRLWQLPLKGQPWATPILNKENNKILSNTGIGQIGRRKASDRGWAQAISLDGKLIWETELPDMALAPNIYIPKNDIIIYTCKNGSIIALNAETGKEIWNTKLTTGFVAEASSLEGKNPLYLAALSEDGILFILESETGNTVLSMQTNEQGASAPSIARMNNKKLLIVPTVFHIKAWEIIQ